MMHGDGIWFTHKTENSNWSIQQMETAQWMETGHFSGFSYIVVDSFDA